MKKIKIIESRSEIGAGTRGSSLGTQAIMMAALNQGSKFFNTYSVVEIPNVNKLLSTKTDTTCAKHIEGVIEIYDRFVYQMGESFEEGAFPIVLAGDHSSAGGTIAGIKSKYPNKRLGVIWIDAHADLHSPYTSPSGNIHGMPLAASLGLDNLISQRKQPSTKTEDLWNRLKSVGGICPKILPQDLVFIGLRDTEEEEDYLVGYHGIKTISVSEVRIKGIDTTVQEVNDYLSACDIIYVSFDVDSMDPHYTSYGTGTPVPIGFSEKEATQLVEGVLAYDKVGCFEITEVNPILDYQGNKMAETAFRILETATKIIVQKHG